MSAVGIHREMRRRGPVTLTQHRMPPDRLSLEITETAAINDLPATVACRRSVREMGVGLSLDDYGTGWSSLTFMRRLPIGTVKVDKSFVDDADTDLDGTALVDLVIQTAHSLGLQVCAEGVERVTQLEKLMVMGCDSAQGYLLGPPSRPRRQLQP